MFHKLTLAVVFVFVSIIAKSQLCQGSLGDPVINVTFGAGTNPGAALNAATTNYTYISSDCPNDGYYTIRNNNVSSCFGNSWHTLSQDHTGNPYGYYMLVNASYTPSDFYLDTIHGLCANSTYEFAAWILNMMLPSAGNSIMPNITFSIEQTNGTVIQQHNTGNIGTTNSSTWVQYGFYFNTPVGITDIVLRMKNNAPGGYGNDLALDDITFRPCGPTVNIASGASTSNTNVCNGDSAHVNLSGSITPSSTSYAYQWQWSNNGGSTWQNIIGATTQNYSTSYLLSQTDKYRLLTAANATNITLSSCRVASNPYTFSLVSNPTIKATSNTPICVGDTVTLNAAGGATYSWTGHNGTITSTAAEFQFKAIDTSYSGTYYLSGLDNNNCKGSDSTTIKINPSPVITLNNDTAICYGASVNLIGNITNGTGFYWSPTTGLINNNTLTPTATPENSTTYYLAANNQYNCNAKDSVIVTVVPPNKLALVADTFVVANQPLQISVPVNSNYQYSWSPTTGMNNSNIPNPIITLNSSIDTITYFLKVTQASCIVDTSSMTVIVFKTQPDIFVPSAFTPNGDGHNETLKAIPVGIKQFNFFNLYNRWGQLIFTTKDANNGWDGRINGLAEPMGTYIYVTQGIDYTGKLISKKGTITLLR